MFVIVSAAALLAAGIVGFGYALYATPARQLAQIERRAQHRRASELIDGADDAATPTSGVDGPR